MGWRDKLDAALPDTTGDWRSKLDAALPDVATQQPYATEIDTSSANYNLNPDLVRRVMMAESNANPRAVSSAGAKGLMQLMDPTAESLGVTDPFDPAQSIEGGSKYLSQMMKQFGGDEKLALAAYNAGPGAVQRHDGIPPYQETQDYVQKIAGKSQPGGGWRAKLDAALPDLPNAARNIQSPSLPSESSRSMIQQPPDTNPTIGAQPSLGFLESIKSVGSGVLGGALGVEPSPVGSPVARAMYEHREDPSNIVGQGIGMFAPYGVASKGVSLLSKAPRAAKALSKLPKLVQTALKSGATGAGAEGIQQVAAGAAGEETDLSKIPEGAAAFAAIDVGLRGAGGAVKKAVKIGKKLASKIKTPEFIKQSRNLAKLPDSKRVVKMVEGADEVAAGHRGKWGEELTAAVKGVKSGEQLGKDLQSGKAPEVRRLLDKVRSTLKASGSDLGQVKNYFPRVFKEDVAEAIRTDLKGVLEGLKGVPSDQAMAAVLKKKSQITQELVANLRKSGMSTIEAIRSLRKQVGRELFPTASFEKTRTLDLPASVYETDALQVLPRYITAAADRVAQLQTFGKKGQKLDALLARINRQDPDEAANITKIVDTWSGKRGLEEGFTGIGKKLSDAAIAGEVGLKIGLGTATVPNITQSLISTFVDLGAGATVKGAAKSLLRSQRGKVRETGAIRDAIHAVAGTRPGGAMGKFADAATTLSGFQGINKANLYVAASSFESGVKTWMKQARKTGYRGELARDRLSDYGINWKKPLNEEQLSRKMYRFATDSQLQKNVLKDPLFFNDPKWRPWLLFKRFGMRQATYMKDVMLREIKRPGASKTTKAARTAQTVLRAGAGGYLGGEFVVWAKNLIKSTLTGDSYYRKDDHLTWERALNNYAAVGTMGILTDIADTDSPRDFKNKAKFLLNPVLVSDFMEIAGGDPQNVIGSLPKWSLRRLRGDESKERSNKTQRGRERNAILDLFAAGEATNARRRMKLWKENNPDFPFTASAFTPAKIQSRKATIAAKESGVPKPKTKKRTSRTRRGNR